MSKNVIIVGDKDNNDDTCIQGSPNVFINNKAIVRQNDKDNNGSGDNAIATTTNIFVNNLLIIVDGDQDSNHDNKIHTQTTVFVGP